MSSISEVIHAHVDKILNEIHTSFPAKILRYDHDRQVADLQPTIKKKFRDGTVLDLPVLHDVPILFYAAKDCVIGLPVGEGDTVLVLISERSIDGWLHSDGDIVDPDDIRKFNLSDEQKLQNGSGKFSGAGRGFEPLEPFGTRGRRKETRHGS